MDREILTRWLTIGTPLVAFLCATGASAFEIQRLRRLEGESAATETQIRAIDRELRSYEAQPQTEKYPTVPKSPREQAEFLDALRANADVCKVQLVRWSNIAPAPQSGGSSDRAGAGLPTGVSAIISVVEASGGAENTRQFLYNIVRSRRLLNMSDIKWVRDTWPNTHLTCTLTRYVAPPVPLPVERPHSDHAALSHARPAAGAASTEQLTPAAQAIGSIPRNGMALPNPMDAPGIAHGSYQSRLEAGVSQLNEIDRSHASASPHTHTVTNEKH